MNNLFSGSDLIFSYTRAQAIEDGVLFDVTELAKEASFAVPVAITASLFGTLDPSEEEKALGQDYTGRLWDVLDMLHLHILHFKVRGTHAPNPLEFSVIVAQPSKNKNLFVKLWSMVGPGDNAEPVITIGFPEDF